VASTAVIGVTGFRLASQHCGIHATVTISNSPKRVLGTRAGPSSRI